MQIRHLVQRADARSVVSSAVGLSPSGQTERQTSQDRPVLRRQALGVERIRNVRLPHERSVITALSGQKLRHHRRNTNTSRKRKPAKMAIDHES